RRRRVLGRRSRLDQRDGAERQANRTRETLGRRQAHTRLDRGRFQPAAAVIAAIATDEALLALKIAFLVLLYVFIWMIVRSATRDVRSVPQESIVLSPAEASALRAQDLRAPKARLAVVASPTLPEGRHVTLTEPTTVGRAPGSGLRLENDDYV